MNRKGHLVLGLLLFPALIGIAGLFPRINTFLLISGAGAVAAGSIFPDIIEPPTSKRHRGIFHSRRALGGVLAGLALTMTAVVNLPAPSRLPLLFACSAFFFGYATHLLADSLTPSGLPA